MHVEGAPAALDERRQRREGALVAGSDGRQGCDLIQLVGRRLSAIAADAPYRVGALLAAHKDMDGWPS
jgi:hypothetical protein